MTVKGENTTFVFRNLIEEHEAIPDVVEGSLCSCGKKLTLTYKERDCQLPNTEVYEYLSENIYYCLLKHEKKGPESFTSKMPEGFVQMVFCLKGACHLQTEACLTSCKIGEQQHNLLYIGDDEVTYRIPSEQNLELLIICIKHAHFLKYSLPNLPQLDSFRKGLSQKEFRQLHPDNFPLTYKISLVVEQLLREKAPEAIRYHFVEAKVAELLMLQLALLFKPAKKTLLPTLKVDEIEKMQKVKQLLLSSMGNGITLKYLAQEVGTNEYNLKKHFKMVFGHTVFGYLHAHKMQLAKTMLLDTQLKVADIAEKLGYKHATHFSAAFKKQFGYLPGDRQERGH